LRVVVKLDERVARKPDAISTVEPCPPALELLALREWDAISLRVIRKRLGFPSGSSPVCSEFRSRPCRTGNRMMMEPATRAVMRMMARELKTALRALRRHAA